MRKLESWRGSRRDTGLARQPHGYLSTSRVSRLLHDRIQADGPAIFLPGWCLADGDDGPVDEAQRIGGGQRLHSVADAELPEEPRLGIFHGLYRDTQRAGGLPHCVTAGYRAKNVVLPRRELRHRT